MDKDILDYVKKRELETFRTIDSKFNDKIQEFKNKDSWCVFWIALLAFLCIVTFPFPTLFYGLCKQHSIYRKIIKSTFYLTNVGVKEKEKLENLKQILENGTFADANIGKVRMEKLLVYAESFGIIEKFLKYYKEKLEVEDYKFSYSLFYNDFEGLKKLYEFSKKIEKKPSKMMEAHEFVENMKINSKII